MNSFLGLILSFVYIIVLLFIAMRLEHIPNEFSRTFVHILVSNWWLIAMFFIDNYWMAISVPAVFILFNALNIRFNWISAINSKQRYGNFGTIYYALAVFILTAVTFMNPETRIIGGVGVLAMGYGDGFAALIGQKFGKHSFRIFKGTKSLEGSSAMFITTLVVVGLYLAFLTSNVNLVMLVIIAAVATVVEAISPYGLDNLFIPVLTSLLYFIFTL